MDKNDFAILHSKYEELRKELDETKSKLEIYRNAINRIGLLGYFEIDGQYERYFNECLKHASDAFIESGDAEEG